MEASLGSIPPHPLDGHLRALGISTVVIAGCNYPNCPRATVYGASERDYRTLIAEDAIPGLNRMHLAEAARMGVLHAPSTEMLRWLTPG
ncbi:isochorismatase family protein [Blastococcus sp. SYSU DS0973]